MKIRNFSLRTKGMVMGISLLTIISACKKNNEEETTTPEVTKNQWVSVSVGDSHAIALTAEGAIWGWGNNTNGLLGTGTEAHVSTPIQLQPNKEWKFVKTGTSHTMAIKKDGSLWAWGINTYGELGNGTKVNASSPVQVGTDKTWKTVAVGGNYTLAIREDGSLWSWGNPASGRLGNGLTSGDVMVPTRVGTDNTWAEVFSWNNWGGSFAIKKDGTLWAWGVNQNGMLGTGNTTTQLEPTLVGGTSTYKTVASGRARATLAIKKDGTLWAVGRNSRGELGLGNTDTQSTWAQVGTDKNWESVALFNRSVVATKTDGSLWIWGDNVYGELGNGKFNTDSDLAQTLLSPTKLDGQTNVKLIAVAFNFSVITKGNVPNTLYVAGSNIGSFPSLGLGNTSTTAQTSFKGNITLP
ncbi:Regulator of chromosome condensation (RCC1) repeat protein [compost metagenome]